MLNRHAHIRPIPESEADPFAPGADEPIRVLLVEDQEDAANSLSMLLRMDGFIVSRAPDGPSALAAAHAGAVDAVVLDVKLPGLDGFEVCRRLRADPVTTTLVIVMLTGLDDTPSKLEGLGLGADDYLVKPIASRELGARVRKLLDARETRLHELREERLQTMGQIATAVCHEIANPLTAALGSVDLLLLTRDLEPEVRRELEECQKHLIRIGRIIGRLDDVQDRAVVDLGGDRSIDLHY